MSGHKSQHGKNNPSPKPKQASGEEKSTNRHVFVEPGVQIDLVQDLKEKYETSQQQSEAHSKKILLWTKVSALLIFIYAGLTWWQGCYTRKAANAASDAVAFARQQFRMDQRPYMSADPRGANKPRGQTEYFWNEFIPGGVRVGISMDLKNGGKSPAVDVVNTLTQYKIGPRDEVRKGVQSYVPEYLSTTAATFVPVGGILVPGSDVKTISDEEYQKLKDGTWEFYVVGAVKYRDMFQPAIDPYETTYCYQVVTRGMPFGGCQFKPPHFGNSIK